MMLLAYLRRKYLKPKSLTWWTGFITLMAGLFVAAEPLHGLQSIVEAVMNATGGIPASAMIVTGLTAIGLRGKDD